MTSIDIAHPHDHLTRRFLIDPELMADLLAYYPQKDADQNLVRLLDLKHLECKSPVSLQALIETLQLASEGKLVANFDRITDYFLPIKNDPRAKGWLCSLVRYTISVVEIGSELIVKAYSKVFNKK